MSDSPAPFDRLNYPEPIEQLLNDVITRIDQSAKQAEAGSSTSVKLSPECPRGRAAQNFIRALKDIDIDDERLWEDFRWLSHTYGCFKIDLSKKRRVSDPDWVDARLRFIHSSEELVRAWIGRPKVNPIDSQWQSLLRSFSDHFECPDAVAGWKRPEMPPGFKGAQGYERLLECWSSIGAVLGEGKSISWRQLSARCFLADSKYLDSDSHQSLVRRLFPARAEVIVERPILLHAYLPDDIHRVLIVENQDTFTEMADLKPQKTALVYGMGYRAGAMRVRQSGIPNFSLYGCAVGPEVRRRFEQWWVAKELQAWGVYFFGDLDYSGLDIAASLKQSFPELECWQPGYEQMLHLLGDGGGHLPEQSGKARQRVRSGFGCEYSERVLLPALKSGRFADQEVVDIPDLFHRCEL